MHFEMAQRNFFMRTINFSFINADHRTKKEEKKKCYGQEVGVKKFQKLL